jgi:hypothetical protein
MPASARHQQYLRLWGLFSLSISLSRSSWDPWGPPTGDTLSLPHALEKRMCCPTREWHIYHMHDFYLYRVFFPPVQIRTFVLVEVTNQYKYSLTEARRGLIQPNKCKCLTFVPVGGSARCKCEVITFVPGEYATRYKCMAWYKCATTIMPSSSACLSPLLTLLHLSN